MRAELAAAHAAVDEAVAILRDGRAKPHERIDKAAKDFLTDVDLASESALQRSLAASTPDVGFYGEEGGGAPLDSGKVWVADPLDGTDQLRDRVTAMRSDARPARGRRADTGRD